MKQWKSLALQTAPWCFPHHHHAPATAPEPAVRQESEQKAAVRLVGCDGRVQVYRRPVTARELMQQHPRHLVCRSDALLIGERLPAVAPAEELQPGQAYFLLPAHLFHSVLSFVSLASSLLLLLSASSASSKKHRPFELCRTASGTLQIKFSDDFLVDDDAKIPPDGADQSKKLLCSDERLEKEYEELVGYGKARRWAPKLETIQEVVPGAPGAAAAAGDGERRRGRGLPFLGRLGSRRGRRDTLVCGHGNAVACSS